MHISPSNKRYYGITKLEPKKRWKNGQGYKNNDHFYRAINKYGWNNFQHKILFNNLTEDEAKLLEQFYITLYDTINSKKGYNKSLGGESWNMSEETKKKISKAHTGKTHSKETKEKMSKNNYMKKPENKAKFSGKNHPMYGRTHSEETKKKISKNHANVNGKNNPIARNVICITTGRIFYTVTSAAQYAKIKSTGDISNCCKGKAKSAGKLPDGTKLVWKYINYKHNKTYRKSQ